MSIMNTTPLLVTLFLLLQSAASWYPSQSSPSPSPLPSSELVEPPQSPSPFSSPAQPDSPPAPPMPSSFPIPDESPYAPMPTPADDAQLIPTPPPEVEHVADAEGITYVTKEKKSSGGNGVGTAFGWIGAACVVVFAGAVYKKRRDNIRRSRRYSAANIQLI